MGLHDPFEYLQHKLWPKERLGVKVSIWFPITKSQESPWITCVKVACHISLEISQKMQQFCFKPHLNWRFEKKFMGVQNGRNPNFENYGIFDLGIPRKKWHLDVASLVSHREYYKGEGGGFPQVWVVMSFVSLYMFVVHPCNKSVTIMH
jgi:hypothetical protein